MGQIRNGGPVTLTDRRMTRFAMTIENAAEMVLKSVPLSRGGEVFVTKMPVVRIPDLAETMIEILAPRYGHMPEDVRVVEIGAKPGEKLYEELMSGEEIGRALELKDMFVITPAFKSIYQSIQYEYPDTISDRIDKPYISSSEHPFDREALKKYVIDNGVFDTLECFSAG
jgi:FlaA1/EpsC-like NDP-sugar epimerase